MVDLNAKLLPDKASRTFTTEQVLGPHRFDDVRVEILELYLNRICLVFTVILEANNGPGSKDGRPGLLHLIQEHSFDLSLVHECRKGVSRVDEARAAGPATSAVDTFSTGLRIPEGDIIDLCRLVCHQLAFQTEVSEDLDGTRLDAICATRRRRYRTIVNVLDLIAPSGQAQRQEKSNGTSANNDYIIGLPRGRHVGCVLIAIEGKKRKTRIGDLIQENTR